MPLSQYQIADGIRLHYDPADKFKSNELTVSFLLPLQKETAALNSLLPNVLTRATEHYPTFTALNDRTSDLYGASISIDTEKKGDVFCLSISFAMLRNELIPDGTDVLGGTLDLLQEILYRPLLENGVFSERIVALEKENAIAAIKSLIGNKRAYAGVRLIDEMCKNERYSVRANGTVADTEAITPKSLYSHYLEVLKTAQIELFFIGSCDPSALADRLRAIFAHQERKPLPLPQTEIIKRAAQSKEIVEKQSAKQSNLVLGFRGVPTRTDLTRNAAFAVFCDLYGISPTGKLFMNVREKKSLCYFCRAAARAQKGILLVQAGIAAKDKEQALAEILYQLSLCQQGEISDEEIFMAKREITNTFRAIFDQPSSLQNYYLGTCIDKIDYSIDEYLTAVNAVTKEEIIAAANGLTLDTVFFLEGTEQEDDEHV